VNGLPNFAAFAMTNFGIDIIMAATALPTIPYGRDLQITASVVATGNGPTPTGTTTYLMGDTVICANMPLNLACDVGNALAVGTYQFIAKYSGDSNYRPQTSDPLPVQVVAASTTTAVNAPSTVGQVPFNASVTVTAAAGSTLPVSGTVQLYLDEVAFGAPIGVANGNAGPVSMSIGVAGPHTLSAVYSGTPRGYASSTGSTTITVTAPLSPASARSRSR
jgi:hypothetical protein